MTAEYLIQNQGFLVDYVFGNLPDNLEKEINHIVESNVIINEMVDDLTYIAVALRLDGSDLKAMLDSMERNINEALSKAP